MKSNYSLPILRVLSLLALMSILTFCDKDNTTPQKSSISGVVHDAVTFENLTGAIIGIEPVANKTTASGADSKETIVDENGKFLFEDIRSGIYSLYFQMPGYKSMFSSAIDLKQGDAFVAFLPVKEDVSVPIGGITGVVRDTDGNRITHANIAISAQDESITNGYFSSVTSAENGQFFIGAVPLESTSLFKVRCIATGYKTQAISNISILENEMAVLHFIMEEAELPADVFYEDFEGDMNNWEMTGMWNILTNTTLFNQAYPEFINIAPNDTSEGKIPHAYQGAKMAWYGNVDAGNYMGEQSPFDNPLSGGTSTEPNSGLLLSPPINLAGLSEASVNFWSWFEIESVNPNQFGYDLMEVYVLDASDNETLLGKLNPYTDPILSDRRPIPFTSGGFNQAPVWKYEEFDLTNYAGTTVRLKFKFDTRDGLYNGFRGWFIDNIRVTDKAAIELKQSPDTTRPLMDRDS